MSNSQHLENVVDDLDEFERLLDDASAAAKSDREQEFVASLTERFEKFHGRMFISKLQHDWLKDIANGRSRR